jgi:hypothetical protein
MPMRRRFILAITAACGVPLLFSFLSYAAGPSAPSPAQPQQLQPLQQPPPLVGTPTPMPGPALKPHALESDRDMIIHTVDMVAGLVGELSTIQTEIVQLQQKLDALRAETNQKLDALNAQVRIPPSWSRRLPSNQRWELVFDNQAVLDKETGLVWERSPDTWAGSWGFALSRCWSKTIDASVHGWRWPSVAELQTLFPLLSGHPFTNNPSGAFWSSTFPQNTHPGDPRFPPQAYFVDDLSASGQLNQSDQHRVWCVRGGQETFNTSPGF